MWNLIQCHGFEMFHCALFGDLHGSYTLFHCYFESAYFISRGVSTHLPDALRGSLQTLNERLHMMMRDWGRLRFLWMYCVPSPAAPQSPCWSCWMWSQMWCWSCASGWSGGLHSHSDNHGTISKEFLAQHVGMLKPCHSWLIKLTMDCQLNSLTSFINCSRLTGIVPLAVKEVVVWHLQNKSSLDPRELRNYRPGIPTWSGL